MAPEQPLETAGSARRDSDRLRDCSHLVALLADQLEALEEGDYPRLRELESVRERLAAEMRDEHGPDAPFLSWMLARIEESLLRIEEGIEAERLSRDEIEQLRDGSLPLVRGLPRAGRGTYLTLDPASTKLDVRL